MTPGCNRRSKTSHDLSNRHGSRLLRSNIGVFRGHIARELFQEPVAARQLTSAPLRMLAMAFEQTKFWARNLKRDVVALWIAARDPRTPLSAKFVAGAVAAYALSPIDLIPDFIPVLGYLDDLLLVPVGVLIAVRLIPEALMTEFRRQALEREGKPTSIAAAGAIIAIWLAAIAALAYWFLR